MASNRLIFAGLGLAILVTAIAAVYAKHESRKLFGELQVELSERDELYVEWGQLQIEHSTWSAHARVERLAREQMGLIDPSPESTRLFASE